MDQRYGTEVWNRGMERILQGGMERGYGTGVWNGCGPGACSGPSILTCPHMGYKVTRIKRNDISWGIQPKAITLFK